MTKSKKEIVLTFGLITLFFGSFLQTGCNSTDPEYTIRLDTLDQKLVLNAKYLRIDLSTIQAREESISKELRYMRKFYDKVYTQELGNNLTKYKGIRKTYSNFIKNYPVLFNEMTELEKQASDLRVAVEKNEIDKPTFKKYYETELQDVDNNLAFSEKLSRSIHALEPEYQRISAAVAKELQTLSQTNEAFRQDIERDSISEQMKLNGF